MKSKWVIKKIGDLCDEVIKKAPREIYREKFTYIDISSVDPVQKKIVNPKLLTVDLAPGRARKIVTTGDVIFATTRPYLENIAKIKAEFTNPVASTGFCVMSPKSELLDSDYLFHYVTSPDFINRVVAKQKGAAYPAVSDSDVFNMEIPLPSLEVQKKIVKVLEEKLGKVKEAIKIREEAIADTNKILSTRLTEIFEDGKKQGWEEKRLDDKSTLLMTSGELLVVQIRTSIKEISRG
jgi:type I restriction enzyme S subunit